VAVVTVCHVSRGWTCCWLGTRKTTPALTQWEFLSRRSGILTSFCTT